jgi:hypothetical protein
VELYVSGQQMRFVCFRCGGKEGKRILARQKTDRRVARTQKLLRDGLHSLIHERDYDFIVIKETLDRANVGRSASYMHFRDKDELLVSAFHDILGVVPSARPQPSDGRDETLLWFSLPVFEHLDQLRHSGELKLGPRGRTVLHGHLQKVLAGLICYPGYLVSVRTGAIQLFCYRNCISDCTLRIDTREDDAPRRRGGGKPEGRRLACHTGVTRRGGKWRGVPGWIA